MRISADHILARTKMVHVLLDGVDITNLQVQWADPEAGTVSVRKRSVEDIPQRDGNFRPIFHELTGKVKFAWSEFAAELSEDLRKQLAAHFPEVTGL
jgi:hypothetical protein